MLVKILSFIASVMSNARYKAILIPCTIVVLSITSLTAVALVHDSGSHSAASTTNKTAETNTNAKQPAASPQINSGTQDVKDGSDKPVSSDGQNGSASGSNEAPSNGSKPATTVNPSPVATDITLSAAAVTVEPDGTSSNITATTSDNSSVSWTISPDTNEMGGVRAVMDKSKDSAPNFMFRFRASQNAAAGQYQFTLTAKDPNRNVNISKVITVNVAP